MGRTILLEDYFHQKHVGSGVGSGVGSRVGSSVVGVSALASARVLVLASVQA